jgi:hypothetical protein
MSEPPSHIYSRDDPDDLRDGLLRGFLIHRGICPHEETPAPQTRDGRAHKQKEGQPK